MHCARTFTQRLGLIHDEILVAVPRNLVDQVKGIDLEAMTSQKPEDRYL